MTHEPSDPALSLRARTTQTRALRALTNGRDDAKHKLTQQADALRAADRLDDALALEAAADDLMIAFSRAMSASRTWGTGRDDG